jgi:hypothetical protein
MPYDFQDLFCFLTAHFLQGTAQRLALAAGRTGKTPSQTSTIASKPAPYHQGEALSAARIVGTLLSVNQLLLE